MYRKVKGQTMIPVSMAQVCREFGITRQAYYQQQKREEQQQAQGEIVLELVRQIRRKHPRMGGRKVLFKIQPMLVAEGLIIGRDRFFSLLRGQNMLVERKKAFRRTTQAGIWRAPNLLLGLTVSQPNQVWVCDITYLQLQAGKFAYLFLLMDLFSRCILGWQVTASLAAEGALKSLSMALQCRADPRLALIHHSDHGTQYTSRVYRDTLLANHAQPSMGAVGNCYDNIFAERLIGILKDEYLLDVPFVEYTQVRPAVAQAIHLYNTDRPHLSLHMATPTQVYHGHQHQVPALIIPQKDAFDTTDI